MTAQPVEPIEPDPEAAWSAYETALAGLAVAAVVETGRIVDRLVPPGLLVEEVQERVRGLLAAALARSWIGYRARAANLASIYAAAWRSGVRGEIVEPLLTPPPSADADRLRQAAATVLERAADLQIGAEDIEPDPVEDGPDLAADLEAIERLRDAEQAAEAAEAARLDREAAEALAADLRAEEQAAQQAARDDAAADARERAEAARTARRAARDLADAQARDAADQAAVNAAEAAARAAVDAQTRALAEDIEADRARRAEERQQEARDDREARRERREAQRHRAESVARAEVATAAHEALVASMDAAPEVVGWVRKLDPDPCERCVTWWRSGGDPRAPSPVRPYSVRMKRHAGCQCVQRPVTREESDVRGITDQPEPRARNRRHDRRAARADGTT